MDRRQLLDRAAQSGEERVLLAHILDKCEQSRQRNIPAATDFLSPAEQRAAQELLHAAAIHEGYAFRGGYERAERKMLFFLPDWQEEADESESMTALRCTYRKEDTLTHRDFLGSLMAQGITDSSLKFHLQNAKAHGVTQKEIAAIITHAAFYAGWPKGWAVFNLAKEVWEPGEGDLPYEDEAMRAHAKSMVFPIGQPNTAFAQYFIGNSYLAPISTEQIPFFNVTFEPGCRNNWHIHKAEKGGGQMLVGVAGRGWYQEEGKPAVEILPGTVIHIPANVKHWHGAAKDSWFAHLAFEIPGEKTENVWLEPVNNEECNKLESR